MSNDPEIENEAKTHLSEVNRILAQDSFKEIDEKLENLKNGNRQKLEPSWYKPFQVHSLRHMAKLINRHAEYDIFYSKGSEITHAARYADHIKISSGKISFKPIRFLEGIRSLLFFTISIVIKTYRLVLSNYRPGEVTNFNKKYVEEWRERFINIKSVNYTYYIVKLNTSHLCHYLLYSFSKKGGRYGTTLQGHVDKRGEGNA